MSRQLEAIKYNPGKSLEILDQLLLPEQSVYIPVKNCDDGFSVIKNMNVRGAPAIAIVGCLSLAMELHGKQFTTKDELLKFVSERLDYLVTARPTAVNMKKAADQLKILAEKLNSSVGESKLHIIDSIEQLLRMDIADNIAIGDHGARAILANAKLSMVAILTHCNTGSLATSGYGTALGVIRSLAKMGSLEHAYCTETRPYNQGARLTAYELVHEGFPSTLICDNMAAALMSKKRIDAVVVGADRVARNGDTANKIGTYQLAVVAHHHSVPFYIAAPFTSIDMSLTSGADIPIEERPEQELTHIRGVAIAAPGIKCWNPAFDVTPAKLITGIITERGVLKPEELVNTTV